MKRLDFLKSLAVPFVIPFLPKREEPKFQPGDVAYYNGKKFQPISSVEARSGEVLTVVDDEPSWSSVLGWIKHIK